MLPITECSYKIGYVMPDGSIPHSHNVHSEIIQCFENSGSILINGELYDMKKNGLYFIILICEMSLKKFSHQEAECFVSFPKKR